MKKVYSHPKTVNSNLSIAVNNKMKRVVVSNCKSMSAKCISSTYKGHLLGAQYNSWPMLNGHQCVGPVGMVRCSPHMYCNACVTWYNGISRGSNLPGFCDYAGAQIRAYFTHTIDGSNVIYNSRPVTNAKSCPNNDCQYFSCLFGIYPGTALQFTAQC